MAINGRSKGNRGERIAASLFKTWTGRDFARTPSSGGLQWKTTNSKGDIVCTTEGHYFPFCIEVKNHAEIDFAHLLVPNIKNVLILDFWAQCERDAKKANKIPMLLMRYNGLPKTFFFVVIEKDYYNSINMFSRMLYCKNTLFFWDQTKKKKLIIIPSIDFFKLPYKQIKKTAKLYINGLSK